jgi:hypothetical protein
MARYALFCAFGTIPVEKFQKLVDGLEKIVEEEITDREVKVGNQFFYVRPLTVVELKMIANG